MALSVQWWWWFTWVASAYCFLYIHCNILARDQSSMFCLFVLKLGKFEREIGASYSLFSVLMLFQSWHWCNRLMVMHPLVWFIIHSLINPPPYDHTRHTHSVLCGYQVRERKAKPDRRSHLYRQHPCCTASMLHRCPSTVTYISPADATTNTI